MNYLKKLVNPKKTKTGYGNNDEDLGNVIIDRLSEQFRKPDTKIINSIIIQSSSQFTKYLITLLDNSENNLNKCVTSCKKTLKCGKSIPPKSTLKYKTNKERYETRRKACDNENPDRTIVDVIIPCIKIAKHTKTDSLESCSPSIKKDGEYIIFIIKIWVQSYNKEKDLNDLRKTDDTDFELLEQISRASDLFPDANLEDSYNTHIENIKGKIKKQSTPRLKYKSPTPTKIASSTRRIQSQSSILTRNDNILRSQSFHIDSNKYKSPSRSKTLKRPAPVTPDGTPTGFRRRRRVQI